MWAFPATASTAQEVIMSNNSFYQQTHTNQTDNYALFKQQLLTSLREFLPADTRISIDSFSHNNRLSLDGLTILEPGSNISPTIYLESYFEQYEQGTDFTKIRQQILQYYHEHRYVQNIDVSFFTSLVKVRPRIVYKLIHYGKNRELLKEIPHFTYLDLAITFYYLVPGESSENASILIHNSHLAFWNISKDNLLLFAQQNTMQLLPDSFLPLTDLICSILPGAEAAEISEEYSANPLPMYVLTNKRRYFGACCILYPDVLKKISEKLNDDLILLPSSVHEFILIPSRFADHPGDFQNIVHEINVTGVAPEEILSDSIYFYNKGADRVSLLQS